jgi:hypothetical protein
MRKENTAPKAAMERTIIKELFHHVLQNKKGA